MAARTDRPNNGVLRRQLIVMLDDDTADRIAAEATSDNSQSAIGRDYLLTGMRRKDALERAKARPAGAPRLDGPVD